MTPNPKIRELALQANPASKEIYESDNWEYNCAAWCAQDLEKFAELIVRECGRVCAKIELDEELSTEADIWDGAMMCRVEIMKHFGVKE